MRWTRRRRARTLAGALVAAAGARCSPVDQPGCLGSNDPLCVPPSVCTAVTFEGCGASAGGARAQTITDARTQRPAGLNAGAANGDYLLRNDYVTAVIDALDHPHHLGLTGGSLIDLAPAGGSDHLQQVSQITGILPRDSAHYESVQLLEAADGSSASVVVRGRLEGDTSMRLVTRYELRRCDRGVRIRTELYNTGHTVWTSFLADAYWWGNRGVTAFVPLPGQGFTQPPLDLVNIDPTWRHFPWMAGSTHAPQQSSYATVACGMEGLLHGVQNSTISAAGTERSVVRPGDGLVLERMVLVNDGAGLGGAQSLAMSARRQQFGEATVTLRGRVQRSDGSPVGGDEREASLLFYEPAAGADPDAPTGITPWSEAVPVAADGSFNVLVPSGRSYRVRAQRLGRPVGAGQAIVAGTPLTLTIPSAPRLTVNVVDNMGRLLPAELILVPTGDTQASEVDGSEWGYFGGCAPYLGPPHGAAPACNRALAVNGTASFRVPSRPGGAAASYWVYAHAGPGYTLARQSVRVADGEQATVNLSLTALPTMLPDGALWGDFHVHGGRSFDTNFPDRDRVLTFVTAGMHVIASTEHDAIADFSDAIAALGVGDRIRMMYGTETTPEVPWFLLPGSSFPRVIGHFMFWPLQYDPTMSGNGLPWDELAQPAELFDRMAARSIPNERGVIQMNHPLADSIVGRDLGYMRALLVDPARPLPTRDDGTAQGILFRSFNGRRNIDWDAQEVMQGAGLLMNLNYRRLWHAQLNQGILRAGTANSDSHSLREEQLGYPRNTVLAGMTLATFDRARFNAAVRAGRMLGGNGPVVDATVVDPDGTVHQPGIESFRLVQGASLRVRVSAPPWIPVTEVRVVVNGAAPQGNRLVTGAALRTPADPFGTDGVLRYEGTFDLAGLLGGRDGWLSVEAGMPLPAGQDVPDSDGALDGVYDRIDVNGDGVFAMTETEAPSPAESDPRYHFHVVTPGGWPMAFTNPFVVDVDGNGWTAPGLAR